MTKKRIQDNFLRVNKTVFIGWLIKVLQVFEKMDFEIIITRFQFFFGRKKNEKCLLRKLDLKILFFYCV